MSIYNLARTTSFARKLSDVFKELAPTIHEINSRQDQAPSDLVAKKSNIEVDYCNHLITKTLYTLPSMESLTEPTQFLPEKENSKLRVVAEVAVKIMSIVALMTGSLWFHLSQKNSSFKHAIVDFTLIGGTFIGAIAIIKTMGQRHSDQKTETKEFKEYANTTNLMINPVIFHLLSITNQKLTLEAGLLSWAMNQPGLKEENITPENLYAKAKDQLSSMIKQINIKEDDVSDEAKVLKEVKVHYDAMKEVSLVLEQCIEAMRPYVEQKDDQKKGPYLMKKTSQLKIIIQIAQTSLTNPKYEINYNTTTQTHSVTYFPTDLA